MRRVFFATVLALSLALLLSKVAVGDGIVSPTLTGRYIFPKAYIHTNDSVWAISTSDFSEKNVGISVLTGTSLLTPTYYTVNHLITPTLSSIEFYIPIAPNVYHSLHSNYTRIISFHHETQNVYVLYDSAGRDKCKSGDGKYIYCEGAYKKWENDSLEKVTVPPPDTTSYWTDWVGNSGYMCVYGAYPGRVCCTKIDQEPDWKCTNVYDYNRMAVNHLYVFVSTYSGPIQVYALPELTPTMSITVTGIYNIAASDVLLGVGLYDKYLVYDSTNLSASPIITLTGRVIESYIYSDTIVARTSLGLGIYRAGYVDWAIFPTGIPLATTYNNTTYWTSGACFAHDKNGIVNATTHCLPSNYSYYRFLNTSENAFYLSHTNDAVRAWYDNDKDEIVIRSIITNTPSMPFGVSEDCVFFRDGIGYPKVRCGITETVVLTKSVSGFNLVQGNLLLGDWSGQWYWYLVTLPHSPTLIRQGKISADTPWENVAIYELHLTPAGLLVRYGSNLAMLDGSGEKRWKIPGVYSHCVSPRHGVFYQGRERKTLLADFFTGYTRTVPIEGTLVGCNSDYLFSYTFSEFMVWKITKDFPYRIYLPIVQKTETGSGE